jgi:hypothetical protein
MRPDMDDYPLVTDDLATAEREARFKCFRNKRPYFWAERASGDDWVDYLVAPVADLERSADVGWLLHDTCGEPRDPERNHGFLAARYFTFAKLEAMTRLHESKVAAVLAVRHDDRGNAYVVAPPTAMAQLEEAGWCWREFGSDGSGGHRLTGSYPRRGYRRPRATTCCSSGNA